ncbi:hypothetical protein AAFP30_06245 [Gordonia sp. CPCC 205515]|uniref:hypothetical protein n=1 Tax=Gordonia sp. CPCC 205515 TaxID=3140791 RepID=UPI003AF3B22A
MSINKGRTAAAATALFGAAAAVVVATAPANAVVSSITAQPGSGGNFGTTCTYDVNASASGNKLVNFTDNGVAIGGGGVAPSGGIATVKWTPTTPGTHILKARQVGTLVTRTTTVQVGQGLNLGSLCMAF